VANTNSREWEFANYARIAEGFGYQVQVVEFKVETREQLLKCHARNQHGVPLEVVAGMWARWEEMDSYGGVTVHHVEV
jgi:hypothetical protein